jgi:hypothetical protein
MRAGGDMIPETLHFHSTLGIGYRPSGNIHHTANRTIDHEREEWKQETDKLKC